MVLYSRSLKFVAAIVFVCVFTSILANNSNRLREQHFWRQMLQTESNNLKAMLNIRRKINNLVTLVTSIFNYGTCPVHENSDDDYVEHVDVTNLYLKYL